MSHVLAADIGGTNLRLAVVTQNGKIIAEKRVQAELSRHGLQTQLQAEAHIIDTLSDAIGPFAKANGATKLGIGFPGFFHRESGLLVSSPNLPMLQDFALARRLSDRLGIEAVVENDALCAAIGEHRFGAGKGSANLFHITLGTGIGSGLILNNHPYSGEHGMAMEFGHLCIEHHDGRLCGCGNHGCVEAYASATAIVKRFTEVCGGNHDSKEVFELAEQCQECAERIVSEAGQYLGMAIAEAVKLLDVTTITVSGGLTGSWEMLYPPMQQELDANLIPPLKGKVGVLCSTLEDHAGLLGAAAIASDISS